MLGSCLRSYSQFMEALLVPLFWSMLFMLDFFFLNCKLHAYLLSLLCGDLVETLWNTRSGCALGIKVLFNNAVCAAIIISPCLLISYGRIDVFMKAFHFNLKWFPDLYNTDNMIWLELELHGVSWFVKDLLKECSEILEFWRENNYTFLCILENQHSVFNWLCDFGQVA